MENSEHKALKKRNRGHNKRIGFTEEVITRDLAENLLAQEPNDNKTDAKMFRYKLEKEEFVDGDVIELCKRPKKRKKKETEAKDESEINGVSEPKSKIHKQKTERFENGGEETEDKKVNKSSSKRALKHLKHQQLVEDQRNKKELTSQTQALNYLLNWKYNKCEWKFEKLKQVWLVQNLYSTTKIEDKHWDTVLEYFNKSQGIIRDKIIKEAVRIIEEEELNDQVKLKRAKDIVQNIQ